MRRVELVIFGTGEFAARVLFDLAATAGEPLGVLVVGREATRLAWLKTAAQARARLFSSALEITIQVLPAFEDEAITHVLNQAKPRVIFQAASLQTAAVLRSIDTAWAQLVQQGGLSATAPFQAVLSLRIAKVARKVLPTAAFVNACFPDVVNPILNAAGVSVLAGVGNVAILASAVEGVLQGQGIKACVQMLAHYQQLGSWRRRPEERTGPPPRIWIDGQEVADVYARFSEVMLSPQVAFDISGATAVPWLKALVAGRAWRGHMPGPMGLPGGYPVILTDDGQLALDLPAGITPELAKGWNNTFEQGSGMTVESDCRALYHGRLRELLERHAPNLAKGFDCADVEHAAHELAQVRERLLLQHASP
jgi:hypothetical protein